jgi:hypothetical protein
MSLWQSSYLCAIGCITREASLSQLITAFYVHVAAACCWCSLEIFADRFAATQTTVSAFATGDAVFATT